MSTTVARTISRLLDWKMISPRSAGLLDLALQDNLPAYAGVVVDGVKSAKEAEVIRRNGGVVLEVIDEGYPDASRMDGSIPIDGVFVCPVTRDGLERKVIETWA